MSNIVLKNVYKKYPSDINAVSSFNLEIKDGEIIAFLGPSGCGKTTTLRMIAGLEEISEGELYIDGKLMNDVEPKDRGASMVFQNYALFPYMTVSDNITFGLKPSELSENEIKEKLEEVAKFLDITHLLERKPNDLSGGQKQRVALGRAMIRENKVILLDEPLSNLDAKLRYYMRVELKKLHQKLKTTFVYVTHDQVEAMSIADRIVIMKDGFIKQVGSPAQLYSNPDNLFAAAFLGSPRMNSWEVGITEHDGIFMDWGGVKIKLPESKTKNNKLREYSGKRVIAGIRPEYMYEDETNLLRFKNSIIDAEIEVAEFMGSETHLHFLNAGNEYIARVSPDCTAKSGDKIQIAIDTDKLHFFDIDTENTILT